ncbi:hypothetical protein PTKIN_Ptkin11bG0144700 [Pterospermum kingtungense]
MAPEVIQNSEGYNEKRPKCQLKEDAKTPKHSPKAIGKSTNTVKVTRDVRGEETVRAINPGKTFKNTGWDFSIGGLESTGAVRSAVRPPQVRERKLDVAYN